MDVNETLRELRRLADLILNTPERDIAASELAEHFAALDDWLCRGGFLPAAWQRGPEQPHERSA